jgi:RHS repeat-associated protein
VTTTKLRIIPVDDASNGQTSNDNVVSLAEVEVYTTPEGGGTQVQRFDAWGNQTQSAGAAIPQYGYTGREPTDAGIGLIYYRARYYDPTIGRFISRDPAGMVDGVNRYAYVSNDPVNATDPSGLLLSFTLNAFSKNPIPNQDAARISSFANGVALAGASAAAAPALIGLTSTSVLGGAGSFAAMSGSAFTTGTAVTSGVIAGTTSALTAYSLGDSGKNIALAGGVGFVGGVFSSGYSVVGGLANMAKGAVLGAATTATTQGIDIGTSSTKSFEQDFSIGKVLGAALGGGIGTGLTAPFGRSIAEQASAASLKFGFGTAGKGIGEALGSQPAYFSYLEVGGAGNQTLLGASPR